MGPDEIDVLWELAILLHGQARYSDALDCMQAVEACRPDDPVVVANLGVVYRDCGDLDRAENYLRRACDLDPENPATHFHLAVTLLRTGRLRDGFREYEWRRRVPQIAGQRREFSQPLWRGEPLEGRRILLWGEQGAGDALQFVRYAPMVRQAGGDVVVEVLPHLERLMRWMDGGFPVVNALTEGVTFDVQCPLMSLPERFGTELENIPAPARFSIPNAVGGEWVRQLHSERVNVGVVWSGNPLNNLNDARSMPARYFLPLAQGVGIRCRSLQVGPAASEMPDGFTDLSSQLTDFAETAAAISALDLVITVDTAVAHLAGSLGKPVWVLLHDAPCWRWLLKRDDSPWYPGMRLFRQRSPGAWGEVMGRVEAALSGLGR